MTQSPEGFLFKKIYAVLDTKFPSQELAWQLGKNAKFWLNFNFRFNMKLTYDFELRYMEDIYDHLDEMIADSKK